MASFGTDAFLSLLARLMGQYCFARWRLLSVVVVCNTVDGGPAAGRVGSRAADTARQASTVTFRLGDTLFFQIRYRPLTGLSYVDEQAISL